MYKNICSIVITLILFGCIDDTPIKFTEQTSNYLGVWQYRYENKESNLTEIDNMLLIINHDGTAIYRLCEVNEKKSENYKSASRNSASFPEAVVTQITENKIILVQKVGWFGFKKKLNIVKTPYQENGNWYIIVEGKKLVKLQGQDIHTETNWDCPSYDEEK